MQQQADAGKGMHLLDGVLVVQAPRSFDETDLRRFQKDLLGYVHASSPRGVVIDVSRVTLLDSVSYEILANAARMARMLGPRVVFAGFQPGVVSALMDLNVDCSALVAARSLEDAMAVLGPAAPAPTEDEDESASDADAAADAAPAGEAAPEPDGA